MASDVPLSTILRKSVQQRTFSSPRIKYFFMAMRHGQALYTPEEDEGGDIVEGKLTDEGKIRVTSAAVEIAQELQKAHNQNLSILTSPKNRCRETTEIVARILEEHAIFSTQQVVPQLRDVQVIGPQENIPNSYTRWEQNMLPGENWFDAWQRKANNGMEFFEGEESPTDVKERVANIIDMLSQNASPLLLVCHEEILGALADILGFSWDNPDYGEVWYIYPAK